MTTPCTHPRTGIVTSHPEPGSFSMPSHATTYVCDLPECIEEAKAWVTRMTYGKPAFHVLDGES